MKNEFKGFGNVFSFTFRQHTRSASYRNTFIILLLLFFLLPALLMPAYEAFFSDDSNNTAVLPDKIFILDNSGGENCSWEFLNQIFPGVSIRESTDLQKISSLTDEISASLIIILDKKDGRFALSILLPENSELNSSDAEYISGMIEPYMPYITAQKLNVPIEDMSDMLTPVITGEQVLNISEETLQDNMSDSDSVHEIFSMALTYITVLLLYFMILVYGQSVATSIVMEKNSKLIDVVLVSVKPGALLLGKVSAITLAGIIEFAAWIIGAVGGFGVGAMLVKTINPNTDMAIISLFDSLGSIRGLFSFTSIIGALLILVTGIFLYCSLAAIGGAAAGKPEDLSSTNFLFTLALVISFLFTIGVDGTGNEASWIEWCPFTAVLIMPGRILLGDVGPLQIFALFSVLALSSLIVVYISGKLYKMMVFYRGKVPKPAEIFKMIFSRT